MAKTEIERTQLNSTIVLPMELVMLIRKQATDISNEEHRLEKQKQKHKQKFSKILFYIETTKCEAFYPLSTITRNGQLLDTINKIFSQHFIERWIFNEQEFNLEEILAIIAAPAPPPQFLPSPI